MGQDWGIFKEYHYLQAILLQKPAVKAIDVEKRERYYANPAIAKRQSGHWHSSAREVSELELSMQIITLPEIMQAMALDLRRAERPIGLVPTMGFLHAGHLSLVKLTRQTLALKRTASIPAKGLLSAVKIKQGKPLIVLSLFVNPTQFGPNEDFTKYPRNFEQDCRLCEQVGVDIVFHPSPESMYSDNPTVIVDETTLAGGLCGAARPGHFRGVLTVVAKLFNLTLPDVAVFGQKDAQQVRLIRQMARDLNFPVRIISAPIMREPGGLALSSRNTYLSPAERQDALCLVRSLQLARRLYRAGERETEKIMAAMTQVIQVVPTATIDYIQAVDDATLQPVSRLDNAILIALAVRIGKTRLIDNLMLPDDRLCNLPGK